MASLPGSNATGSFIPGSGENMAPRTEAVVWSLTAISGLFMALRMYCKFSKSRGLWWDDYVLVASWFCFVGEAVLMTVNSKLGFGHHIFDIDPRNLPVIGMQGLISGTFSIVAAIWSKTSFGITLLRLTEGNTKLLVWAVIISMNIFMGLSALFQFIQCWPVQKNWQRTMPGSCWDPKVNIAYGIFAGVYSGLMDWLLALLPWKLLWGLQMKRKEKFGVGLAMSMGLFAGATAFVKSSKIPTLGGGDFTFEGYHLLIWGAAEISTTIIAASIPVLRVLVREVKSSARHYGSSTETYKKSLSRSNTVVVASNRRRKESRSNVFTKGAVKGDDSSDKSILVTQSPLHGNKILQTQEIAVEYHARGDGDEELGYEMGRVTRLA